MVAHKVKFSLSLIVATASYSTVATVGIAVGIVAVVIICMVIVAIVIVLAVQRWRNAERKKQLNESTMKRHVCNIHYTCTGYIAKNFISKINIVNKIFVKSNKH